MIRKGLVFLTLVFSLFSSTLTGLAHAANDPTLHQVYEAAAAGNDSAAQTMMDQVLRNHPNSAKAHFVEAELLAKQGQLSRAQSELNTAERLDPTLAFAKPGAVAELRTLLHPPARLNHYAAGSKPGAAATATTTAATSLPWGWLLMGGGLLVALLLFAARRNQATTFPAPAGTPYPHSGYANGNGWGTAPYSPNSPPTYPPAGPASTGGMGSGILGGLATGAAIGAGVVAGEALMHRMLDGDSHPTHAAPPPTLPEPDDNLTALTRYDMGGDDFGVNDASSWEDGGAADNNDWG